MGNQTVTLYFLPKGTFPRPQPAHRLGGLGTQMGTLWEKAENGLFGFSLSPPVNKPLLPPAQAGGRAMRRWS